MPSFTGTVKKRDYSEFYKASNFPGTYEQYLAHKGLSGLSVTFDDQVNYPNGSSSAGAFISPELVVEHGLCEGNRIEGRATTTGGGAHVDVIIRRLSL